MPYPTTDDELAARPGLYWDVTGPLYDYGTLVEDTELAQAAGDYPLSGIQSDVSTPVTGAKNNLLLLKVA